MEDRNLFKDISKVVYKKKNMLSFEEYFELEINEDASIIKYNNKIKNINDELVMNYFDRLFRIIDGWKEEYIDNTVICGKTVQILVITDKEVNTHIFKNSFQHIFI